MDRLQYKKTDTHHKDSDSCKKPMYEGEAHSRMCRRIQGHEGANSIKALMMFWPGHYFIRDRSKQRSAPVAFVLTALENCVLSHWSVRLEWREKYESW